jgi:drug/metabolite transporter (DMT)-like permease
LPRACFFLGLVLFAGTTFQQVGMIYTTAGKAGFITALYIVAVPLLGFFIGQPFRLLHLVGLGLAMVGLYLLAFQSGSPLNFGDLLELCGVLFWGLSILGISSFVKYYASIVLAFGQLLVCTLLNLAAMLLTGETLTTAMIMQTLLPILYAGIMSSGVAYTLQVFGQAKVPPTEASLLLSMEMVFGALSGYLLLGETMNARELLGCALMACGIFAAQVPSRILWQRHSTQTEENKNA